MLDLGNYQTLTIRKLTPQGAYLADDEEERVLLPGKQLPDNAAVGDTLKVFLYRDSEDRPIATLNTPLITLGGLAVLEVKDVSRPGAFLDWGLEKDLFLPYREQTRRVHAGEQVLVTLYLDKSKRLAATMNVYNSLSTDTPYTVGDDVEGIIYQKSDNFGMFVAVDQHYSALIPKRELYGNVEIGDHILARVSRIRDDGRMDLSIRDKSYLQIEPDSEKILALLDSYQGVLPFSEKADPEIIRRETGMSKNEFKRAVGHLYKARLITINEGIIRKV